MAEIEERLRNLRDNDLIALNDNDDAKGRPRGASNASLPTNGWGDGNVKWTDLGGYVVLASVGVGLAVGQVVLSKVFGVRH